MFLVNLQYICGENILIMDREELLRSARNLYENPGTNEALKVVLEETYPELKESEDERINKFLCHTFTAQYLCKDKTGKWHGEPVTNILAYLEKQKEQKPIFKRGDKVIWNGEEYNILDVNKDSYNVGGYILPFYRQNELSLIEQRPAERVEINKSLSDAVITELGKYNGENYWKSPWAMDSTGLQYPLYFANFGAIWQKEQQPAEWSEDDEIEHDYLCKLLRETWDKVDKGSCIDNAITWFEKLPERIYPHSWKPSEEQIGILGKLFAGCQLKDSERDSMVDLFYHLKDMI